MWSEGKWPRLSITLLCRRLFEVERWFFTQEQSHPYLISSTLLVSKQNCRQWRCEVNKRTNSCHPHVIDEAIPIQVLGEKVDRWLGEGWDLERAADAISKRKKVFCRRMLGSTTAFLDWGFLTCVVCWEIREKGSLNCESMKGSIFLLGTRCWIFFTVLLPSMVGSWFLQLRTGESYSFTLYHVN